MPAMLQQHLLLRRCRQQSEPRHTRKVTNATDTQRASHARAGPDRRSSLA
jgi:hypothetical protein